MGLFDKKYCDICGEKIGLFGNKKLEDGNMCKDCARKLSPWFSDRRHSTLEEIREQLKYREENKQAVEAFHCTLQFGEYTRVLIDEAAGTFMVTSAQSSAGLQEENPDVFSMQQIRNISSNVTNTRSELYTTDRDGNRQSYNPPRYRYHYRFYVTLELNHPYVDEIQFQMNQNPVEIEHTDNGFSLFGDSFHPTRDYEYRRYQGEIQELTRALRPREEPVQEPAPSEPEPQQEDLVTCPYCGSRVKNGKFCENCGGPLQAKG